MPTSTQLTVTRQNISDGLYGALFVSELQQSDNPTINMVAEAITRTMQRFGTDGCAGQMAQEFGDHPDTACDRMRWVRQLAAGAGLPDGPPAMTLRRDRRQAAIRGGSEADGRPVAGHERIAHITPIGRRRITRSGSKLATMRESLRRARRGPAREAGMTGTMRPQLQPPLTPFVDPLPLPRRILAGQGGGELTVRIRAAAHRFHRDLPESRVWAYEGLVPGPTVEAERGQPVRVCWRNEIDQPYPVVVTLAPAETDGDGVPVQCLPGLSGGTPDPDAAALTGYTVVHLHGAVTAAPSDGWTENVFAPGQHAVSDYPMDQRAALLWYHDHVMGVTRLTVYAGLAGLWIIRDQRERELGLPEGPPFEVPLLVQDRNFGQAAGGRLTSELVHKTDPGTMEAFAPFTVVNGKVWPVHDVQPATCRLRVLNGSNARTFRLVLLRDGRPELDRITQIGTDSGLLPAPVAVPADGLVLAPAERADLLVDFSGLAPGGQLTLANTAGAPFDGHPFPATGAAEAADPGQLLPYPDVMRFRAVAGHPARRPRPGRLATDITAPTQADLSGAVRRAVALAEQELDSGPNMVTMRELAVTADGDPQAPVITVVSQHGQTLARLRTAAVHFEDAATFFPVLGRWEVWQLINLTGDTHPIHIHLEPFHVLARRPITVTVPGNGIGDRDTTATVRLARDPGDELDHVIDANERGLKDTVRVNPHEIVELAIRFQAYSGRYMYHCHILEHEDRDMMRPIVIMPAQLMPFMS